MKKDILNYDSPMIISDPYNDSFDGKVFISFNGPNPSDDYLFEMPNEGEAQRLLDFLTERTPISLYRPIS